MLLAAIVVLGLSRCGDDDQPTPDAPETLNARVSEVVDGDTIEVELPDGRDEDVRYIGIDTPETAKLAYVYVPGAARGGDPLGGAELFVNAELVRRGLARTLTIPPNDDFAARFERLAAQAGRAGRGVWAACDL